MITSQCLLKGARHKHGAGGVHQKPQVGAKRAPIIDNERVSIRKHFICRYHVSLEWLEG